MYHSFFSKEAAGQTCNFIQKKTPAQMFQYELRRIFKNNDFTEHLPTPPFTYKMNF